MKISIVATLAFWFFCALPITQVSAQAQPKAALKSITEDSKGAAFKPAPVELTEGGN